MRVLENFKDLFFDVWKKGVSGVNISEILIALLIFLIFLFLRGIFSKFVIKRLENTYLKQQIILIIHWFSLWKDLQNFFQ